MDNAGINNGGTAQIRAAGAVAQQLTLGSSTMESGTLSIGAGGSLTVSVNSLVGDSGTGTLNVTGGVFGRNNYESHNVSGGIRFNF